MCDIKPVAGSPESGISTIMYIPLLVRACRSLICYCDVYVRVRLRTSVLRLATPQQQHCCWMVIIPHRVPGLYHHLCPLVACQHVFAPVYTIVCRFSVMTVTLTFTSLDKTNNPTKISQHSSKSLAKSDSPAHVPASTVYGPGYARRLKGTPRPGLCREAAGKVIMIMISRS